MAEIRDANVIRDEQVAEFKAAVNAATATNQGQQGQAQSFMLVWTEGYVHRPGPADAPDAVGQR